MVLEMLGVSQTDRMALGGWGVSQTEWMALGGWGVSQPKPYVYTSSAENSAALIEKGEVDL